MTNQPNYVISIRPGSAAEKGVRINVPQEFVGVKTMEEIISYVIDPARNLPRNKVRLAEHVRVELTRTTTYSININERAVAKKDLLTEKDFAPKKYQAGDNEKTYLEAEVIVASKQDQGGLAHHACLYD